MFREQVLIILTFFHFFHLSSDFLEFLMTATCFTLLRTNRSFTFRLSIEILFNCGHFMDSREFLFAVIKWNKTFMAFHKFFSAEESHESWMFMLRQILFSLSFLHAPKKANLHFTIDAHSIVPVGFVRSF
jgi:hypothetical protein